MPLPYDKAQQDAALLKLQNAEAQMPQNDIDWAPLPTDSQTQWANLGNTGPLVTQRVAPPQPSTPSLSSDPKSVLMAIKAEAAARAAQAQPMAMGADAPIEQMAPQTSGTTTFASNEKMTSKPRKLTLEEAVRALELLGAKTEQERKNAAKAGSYVQKTLNPEPTSGDTDAMPSTLPKFSRGII